MGHQAANAGRKRCINGQLQEDRNCGRALLGELRKPHRCSKVLHRCTISGLNRRAEFIPEPHGIEGITELGQNVDDAFAAGCVQTGVGKPFLEPLYGDLGMRDELSASDEIAARVIMKNSVDVVLHLGFVAIDPREGRRRGWGRGRKPHGCEQSPSKHGHHVTASDPDRGLKGRYRRDAAHEHSMDRAYRGLFNALALQMRGVMAR